MRRPLVAAALGLALATPAPAAPGRVVSMNLCTDQLALLLAAPGQLVSVSHLAADPQSSPMAEAASHLPVNHGMAEEVYLLEPDLVLAGSFTAGAAVDLLRRLGVPVLVVPPAASIGNARAQITEVGAALGRTAQAEALLDAIDVFGPPPEGPRPTAAIVGANGYASGPESLTGEILAAAGFDNVLGPMGLAGGGRLSLEDLVMSAPDLLVLPEPWPGWSQGEEMLRHPALAGIGAKRVVLPDRNWVCGTPAMIENLDRLRAVRAEMVP